MDFDALLDSATLAETTVTLCLNGKLRAEYEAVKERIDERAAARDANKKEGDDRLATKDAPPDPEQPELDRLAAEMRRYTQVFRLRALPRQDWHKLFADHPPRIDGKTGKRHDRDFFGVNQVTFFPVLLRKSIIDPEISDARWDKLMNALSDAQFDKLAEAAFVLNRVDADVPFSPSGSQSLPSSSES